MTDPSRFYPPPDVEPEELTGIFPVDFLLETILEMGLDWFRTNSDAPKEVFGQLMAPWLKDKYGEDKITEITNYIKNYQVKIVQHWSLIDQTTPSISIQLLEATEEESRASLDDHLKMVDIKNEETEYIESRTQYGYAAIVDNIHIGIHNIETPDLTKYLYYLVIYILSSFKPQLRERGLLLTTFRATDISRLNEYLPENMYSRFINFSTFTIAPFIKGKLPIIDEILGVSIADGKYALSENVDPDGDLNIETGVTLADTRQSDGG